MVFLPTEGYPLKAATEKEVIHCPSGDYEFLHNSRELTGPYLACSLFPPTGDFTNQLRAPDVARAGMLELFRPENRAQTDRAADIRALRQADLNPPEPEPVPEPSRRALITGGLGQ